MRAREIVVVSGKGGTGKTTVTASLAARLAGQALFCDADVDAPNLGLLLDPTPIKRDPFVGMAVASVDGHACLGCGLCSRSCRFGAITVVDGKAVVDGSACEGCALCLHLCPAKAITLTPSPRGEICESVTVYGPLFHGRLDPGGANSGKLVQQIKDGARKKAEESGVSWILVDGPPGIACPALSAMSGADIVLAVTEASRSALSDLKRLVEVTRPFRLPLAVVLNKAGLAPDEERELERFCREANLPLLGAIPFDGAIARAQAKKIPPLAQIGGPLETIFQGLLRLLRS